MGYFIFCNASTAARQLITMTQEIISKLDRKKTSGDLVGFHLMTLGSLYYICPSDHITRSLLSIELGNVRGQPNGIVTFWGKARRTVSVNRPCGGNLTLWIGSCVVVWRNHVIAPIM